MTVGRLLIAMICICGSSSIAGAQRKPSELPKGVRDANPRWTSGWQAEIESQVTLLKNAYLLDDKAVADMREELQARMVLQRSFEETENAKLDKLVAIMQSSEAAMAEGSPESEAAWEQLNYIYQEMPLNETRVADWVEAKLPPERAAKGRAEMEKLWHRREQQNQTQETDSVRRVGRNAKYAQTRDQGSNSRTATNRPKPLQVQRDPSDRAATPAVREPSKALVREQKPKRQPEDMKAAVAGKTAAAKAPPLDDWDKKVDELAQRYQFTEAQQTKGQAILRDLRRRAEQYRLARADDFAAAARLEDPKARKDKERQLEEPLDALFQELQQRLENLATIEQRLRSNSGTSTGKKK